jgi:hypothetical protein
MRYGCLKWIPLIFLINLDILFVLFGAIELIV